MLQQYAMARNNRVVTYLDDDEYSRFESLIESDSMLESEAQALRHMIRQELQREESE